MARKYGAGSLVAGDKFGRLTVVERAGASNGSAVWRCMCECGQEKLARADRLKNGRTKSCGCLRASKMKGRAAEAFRNQGPSLVSLVSEGSKYSRLTVLSRSDRHDGAGHGDSHWYWRCQCQCGNICYIRADRLAHGNTKSCGCLAVAALQRQMKRYGTMLERAKKRLDSVTAASLEELPLATTTAT